MKLRQIRNHDCQLIKVMKRKEKAKGKKLKKKIKKKKTSQILQTF